MLKFVIIYAYIANLCIREPSREALSVECLYCLLQKLLTTMNMAINVIQFLSIAFLRRNHLLSFGKILGAIFHLMQWTYILLMTHQVFVVRYQA